MITDMIDREIKVDDWVVFYSNLYRVRALGKANANGAGTVQILLWSGGITARPVKKHSKEMAIVDRNDVLIWLLKKGYK
jgi:hypothetical protein